MKIQLNNFRQFANGNWSDEGAKKRRRKKRARAPCAHTNLHQRLAMMREEKKSERTVISNIFSRKSLDEICSDIYWDVWKALCFQINYANEKLMSVKIITQKIDVRRRDVDAIIVKWKQEKKKIGWTRMK